MVAKYFSRMIVFSRCPFFFSLSAMQKLLLTLSGLAEKAMMMRFNCQLATNVRKRAELQTCFSPAFYAKPVLNDGLLSIVFFKRHVQFACHVAFAVAKTNVQLDRKSVV